MKQGTVTAIAATMMQDFARTVEVAEKEQAAAIADVEAAQTAAMKAREERQAEIDAKRKDAAELLAQSLEIEEQANADFIEAMAASMKSLRQMATEKVSDVGKLKLVGGRKAA